MKRKIHGWRIKDEWMDEIQRMDGLKMDIN